MIRIKGKCLNWIDSYMSNRQQFVEIVENTVFGKNVKTPRN